MMTQSEIRTAKLPQLHALYAELYGKPTVNRNKQALVKKLSAEVDRRTPSGKRTKRPPADVGIGRVLRHEMRDGTVHECKVLASGFRVGDETYPSLGAAAKAASGQQWNGEMFWGLKPYPKHKAKAKR